MERQTEDKEYTTKDSNTNITNEDVDIDDDDEDVKIEDLDENPDKDDDEDEDDIKIEDPDEDPEHQVFTSKNFYYFSRKETKANAKARAKRNKLLRENLDENLKDYFSHVPNEWKDFCSTGKKWSYPVEQGKQMQYAAKMNWITEEKITELQTSTNIHLTRFSVIWNLKMLRTKRFNTNERNRKRSADARRRQKEERETGKSRPGADKDPWTDFPFSKFSTSSNSTTSASSTSSNSYPPFNTDFARTVKNPNKNPNQNPNKPRLEPSTDNNPLTKQQASNLKMFLNTFKHQFNNKSIRVACMWCLNSFPNLSIFQEDKIKALKKSETSNICMVKKMTQLFHPDKINRQTTDNYLRALGVEITKQLTTILSKMRN